MWHALVPACKAGTVADTPACAVTVDASMPITGCADVVGCGLLAAAAADGAQQNEGDAGAPGGREEGKGGEAHGGTQVRATDMRPILPFTCCSRRVPACLRLWACSSGGLWCDRRMPPACLNGEMERWTGLQQFFCPFQGLKLPAVGGVLLCDPTGRSRRRNARPRASSGCAWHSMTTFARSSSAATAHAHSRERCAAVSLRAPALPLSPPRKP